MQRIELCSVHFRVNLILNVCVVSEIIQTLYLYALNSFTDEKITNGTI